MIDAIVADHQELFRAGLVEVLSVVEDVRIVGQAQSPEQLLSTLKNVNPHVLVLSTNSLPVSVKIERMLKRRKTALQLLAEEMYPSSWTRCAEWQAANCSFEAPVRT